VDPTDGLNVGERLTGAISLFNGVLYFGTFVPSQNPNDACTLGYSRLWGVDQTQLDTASTLSVPVGRLAVDPVHPTTSAIVRVTNDLNGNGIADDSNSVLFGVGIARQPSCATVSSTTVPYGTGTRQWVESLAGGDFRLVAQTGRGGVSAGLSRTNTIVRPLQPPATQVRVDSWAVVVE
jgi:type IV pilus assembly protein PilY1